MSAHEVHSVHLIAESEHRIRAAAENVQQLEGDDDEPPEPGKSEGARPAVEHAPAPAKK